MRVFTAVELPEDVRMAVAAAAQPILAGENVRVIATENLHVTIRFLGEVAPERLPAVCAALAEAASAVPAGEARVVAFEKQRWRLSPQVWCAHVNEEPSKPLSALERAVSARIAPLGFAPEGRRYLPHVTVGRSRRRSRRTPWHDDKDRCGQVAFLTHAPVGPAFPVRELTLFESELTPRGSRYTALGRFPLQPVSMKERP
jgi:2'-5' RNA ligase